MSPVKLSILLGLSFFFGLAFEGFYAKSQSSRPGGIRTFPLISLSGALLYALEPHYAIAFCVGLVVLGIWLYPYYQSEVSRDSDPENFIRRHHGAAVQPGCVYARTRRADARTVGRFRTRGRGRVAAGGARAPARAGADAADGGGHHARSVPDPDRNRVAVAAQHAGDEALADHAVSGVAGRRRRVVVVVRQLSAAEIAVGATQSVRHVAARRFVFIDRDHCRARAAAQGRSAGSNPVSIRHRARDRIDVSAALDRRCDLQLGHRASIGALADQHSA